MLKILVYIVVFCTLSVMKTYELDYSGVNKKATSISDIGAGILCISENGKPVVALGIDYIIELVREERKRGQKDGRSVGYPPIG